MQIPYQKMHGTGNRILIVDSRGNDWTVPGTQKLRELGDKATGPGFDQLLWIGAADDGVSTASYRVFNTDGSEVEQCGNGARCVARYLATVDTGCAREFALQSPAGRVAVRLFDDGQVAVSMGTPIFEPQAIPFVADAAADRYVLAHGDAQIEIAAVSMGNPHAVVEVSDVSRAPVQDLGPEIEHHRRFPEGANVGFAHIRDRQNVELRVHERGVGETAACGTGACAAVVSGQRRGLLDEDVFVHLPGGQVVVSWRGGAAPAWLKGNAELIGEGLMDI